MSPTFKYLSVAGGAFLIGLFVDRFSGLSARRFDRAPAGPSSQSLATAAIDEYAIEGMTCEGCVAAVTAALERVPGVYLVQVSLPQKRAIVVADRQQATADEIAAAVAHAGYQAHRPTPAEPVAAETPHAFHPSEEPMHR